MKRRSFLGAVLGSIGTALAARIGLGGAKGRLAVRGRAVWNAREGRWDIDPSCLMRASKDFASFNVNGSSDAEQQFVRALEGEYKALKDYGIRRSL